MLSVSWRWIYGYPHGYMADTPHVSGPASPCLPGRIMRISAPRTGDKQLPVQGNQGAEGSLIVVYFGMRPVLAAASPGAAPGGL